MLTPRYIVSAFTVALTVLGAGVVSGQNPSTGLRAGFPTKPIRIVTSAAGGGNDFMARLIAQGISGPLGEPVIVDNRTSTVTGEIVSKASPDGYTLIVSGNALWISPFLQKASYDPGRDFAPITLLGRSPVLLVVHPSVPASSVQELIALAKAKPGVLNYAAAATGTPSHLAAELFKAMAGVNIVYIPYKGVAQAVNDLISGRVQLMFTPATSVAPHVKSGRLRAVAVTSTEPSSLFPGLPAVAATVPRYQADTTYAILAPAKTPEAVINRLHREMVEMLNKPDVKEKLLNIGVEATAGSPQELGAVMKSDMTQLGKLIKDLDIKGE
jgi:tripartite-type tricarboxylate transporter receptor subunit TctC